MPCYTYIHEAGPLVAFRDIIAVDSCESQPSGKLINTPSKRCGLVVNAPGLRDQQG